MLICRLSWVNRAIQHHVTNAIGEKLCINRTDVGSVAEAQVVNLLASKNCTNQIQVFSHRNRVDKCKIWSRVFGASVGKLFHLGSGVGNICGTCDIVSRISV